MAVKVWLLIPAAVVVVFWLLWRIFLWTYSRRVQFQRRVVIVRGKFAKLAEKYWGKPPLLETPGCRIKTPEGGDMDNGKHEFNPRESRKQNVAFWGAAAADGMTPGIDMWMRWNSVDEHVFKAVSHMVHEQIDSFADLLRVVDAKGYAVQSAGFFNKLLGHIGEWHVREHFLEAGHTVVMPSGSNEPGVDMWVDGQGVNVKTVDDVLSAANVHFSDHPDIPIVVPADAHNIPPEALHFDPAQGLDMASVAGGDHAIIVDHALSHAELVDQTQNAVDVLSDPAPHAHIPWITIAISVFREGRLLLRGDTDLQRAGKNVLVDGTAVGGGAAIGIKIGGVVGGIFGPLGAALGGAVGGFAGAIAGRLTANKIKLAPLKKAKLKYERALEQYKMAESEAVAYAEGAWNTVRSQEQAHLNAELQRIKREKMEIINTLQERLSSAAFLKPEEARKLLQDAEERIDSMLHIAEHELHQSIHRFFRPIAWIIAPREYLQLHILRRDVKRWKREARKVLKSWPGDQKGTERVFDLLIATPDGEAIARNHLKQLHKMRNQVYARLNAIAQMCLSEALVARRKAVENLRNAWAEIEAEVQRRLEPAIKELKYSSEKYKSELRKAGVKV